MASVSACARTAWSYLYFYFILIVKNLTKKEQILSVKYCILFNQTYTYYVWKNI